MMKCARAGYDEEGLHIDGGKTTVGEGAADGTGEGEARVESDARELLRLSGLDVLLDSVELDAAGGLRRGLGRHCDECTGWSGECGGGEVFRWWWWRWGVQRDAITFTSLRSG
jgi:hypothetical protein